MANIAPDSHHHTSATECFASAVVHCVANFQIVKLPGTPRDYYEWVYELSDLDKQTGWTVVYTIKHHSS